MTNYNQGDVLLLMKFPQTNLEREIKRPALVLADLGDEDIIVVRITGELYQTEYDYVIKNWQRAGLLLPSVIRLGKIATLHKRFINKKLGNLSKDDITKIKEIIKNIFKIGNITS